MRCSQAVLRVGGECGGRTSVRRAFAAAPQRWTWGTAAPDGWADVTHQLLGDGVFGGDIARTSIVADRGSNLIVRGIAATALRAGRPSVTAVRLTAGGGSSLLYLPGPLIPHAGSGHRSSLRIAASGDARVFVSSVLSLGRLAMGERAGFSRLRLRTTAAVDGRLALYEDQDLSPGDMSSGALLNGSIVVSALALGAWSLSDPAFWHVASEGRGLVAASPLMVPGCAIRAVFPDLGAAQSWLADAERCARSAARTT